MAASGQAPISTPPTTATLMSAFMLRLPCRSAVRPLRKVARPAKAMAIRAKTIDAHDAVSTLTGRLSAA